MRGSPRTEYKSDEKDIGNREAFEWSAKVEAPVRPIGTRAPKAIGPSVLPRTTTEFRWPTRIAIQVAAQSLSATSRASQEPSGASLEGDQRVAREHLPICSLSSVSGRGDL